MIFKSTYSMASAEVPLIDRWTKFEVPSRTRYGALYRALEVLRELSIKVLSCVKFVHLKAIANG